MQQKGPDVNQPVEDMSAQNQSIPQPEQFDSLIRLGPGATLSGLNIRSRVRFHSSSPAPNSAHILTVGDGNKFEVGESTFKTEYHKSAPSGIADEGHPIISSNK